MLGIGFTDNGGAIHSAERIINIFAQRLLYPSLSHLNKLSKDPKAKFSVEARKAFNAGEKVLIEHVTPLRAFTRLAISKIEAGMTDDEFEAFVRNKFEFALLTREEAALLNKQNRTKLDPDRLAKAGIVLEPD